MSATQIIVIVLGLVTGYAVISALMKKIEVRPKSRSAESSQGYGDGEARKNERAKRHPEVFPWYVVLDIDQRSSAGEIKRAYKLLMSQYHPDKVARMGVELRQLAELKTQQINEAYRDAMRAASVRS